MTPTGKPRVKKEPPPPTPKQAKPWDLLSKPRNGDQNENITFLSVGKAMSQWEFFEAYLGLIYGQLVGDVSETSPAMRAYGVVSSFSTRLEMIDQAAKAHFFAFPDDVALLLKDLLESAKRFSARRNEIAHGIVQPYQPQGLSIPGYALLPSRHATRKRELSNNPIKGNAEIISAYAYASDEIDYFGECFSALANQAMDFYSLIARRT